MIYYKGGLFKNGVVHIRAAQDYYVCGYQISRESSHYNISRFFHPGTDTIDTVMNESGYIRCEGCWQDLELLLLAEA